MFDRLGIDYYVGGVVASLAHGIYRTTADVDIIAEMPLGQAHAFAQSRLIRISCAQQKRFSLVHIIHTKK